MIGGKNFHDQPIKNKQKHMKTFKKLKLAKQIITQMVVCQITII